MSCNGCRVLRKGCSDSCILRHGLQWIEGADAQGHATLFIAKFFGRAGMLGLISSVSESQRPALFQSLLYEACGRTINPVHGAVGLLCSGNWQLCQAAVETVLSGGFLSTSSAPSRSVARSPFMQMHVNDQVLDGEAEKLPRVRIGRGFLPSSFEIRPSRSSAQEEAPEIKDAFFCRDKRKLDLFDLSINHPEVSKMKCSQHETSSDENSSHLKLDLTLGASNVSSVTFHKPFEAKIRCGSPSSSTTCAHS